MANVTAYEDLALEARPARRPGPRCGRCSPIPSSVSTRTPSSSPTG
ncbi:hypothetical protein LV779_18695 [Streptomyces thinghirensis]|nr:hypothetical protein [Streptomyces thinghirensis]